MSSLLEQIKNDIKSSSGASVTGEGVTVFEYAKAVSTNDETPYAFAKFIAPVDGCYKVSLELGGGGKYEREVTIYKSVDNYPVQMYNSSNGKILTYSGISSGVIYIHSTIGSSCFYTFDKLTTVTGRFSVPFNTSVQIAFYIYCKKGEPVVLYGYGNGSSYNPSISEIKITTQM